MSIDFERAYLSAGSNLGNRAENLAAAAVVLQDRNLIVLRVSSVFETEPLGYADQPWFLNIALEIDTRLGPRELLARCQEVERAFGRTASFRNAPRPLDLDILLQGDRVVSERDLQIPHPRLAERRFVLEPLAEIAPEIVHPVARRTIRELLAGCSDRSQVRPYQGARS
jgi:2-amino-4-hydroxy-6-hydroxymethyldihydropteridine diphosphokinase